MRPEYKRSKVGFPIRKSLDQSSFAAPQGLSQRTTSFIASQRQGIHRMLLRHLITLMIDARPRQRRTRYKRKTSPADFSCQTFACQIHPTQQPAGPSLLIAQPDRMYSLFTISNIRVPLLFKADANLNDTGQKQQNHPHPTKAKPSRRNWWSLTGSNRRPPECKSGALPAELRPQTGSSPDRQIMVGLGRLERPTSPLSGVRSNHLSYRPKTSTKTQRPS